MIQFWFLFCKGFVKFVVSCQFVTALYGDMWGHNNMNTCPSGEQVKQTVTGTLLWPQNFKMNQRFSNRETQTL